LLKRSKFSIISTFISKLAKSQAVTTAGVIYDTIQDWNIADRIKGFSFDTPAVNTG